MPAKNVETFEIEDEADFPHVSEKTRFRIIRAWKIVSIIISWVTVVLYLWDCITCFLSYNYWMAKQPPITMVPWLKAWQAFAIIGCILMSLLIYNTLTHTVKFHCRAMKRFQSLEHQYSAAIEYYLHEIPKCIVYLGIMIKFSVIPDEVKEVKLLANSNTTMITTTKAPPMYFLGVSNYDHIHFKVFFDGLKMLGFLVLSIIEFIHILKDRKKLLMVINSLGAFCHVSLLSAITAFKIKIESNNN